MTWIEAVTESDPDTDREPDSDSRPGDAAALDRPWFKLVGLGMELAGATLGVAAIGWWIDYAMSNSSGVGVGIGALVGFSLGMVRFVQRSIAETRKQSS